MYGKLEEGRRPCIVWPLQPHRRWLERDDSCFACLVSWIAQLVTPTHSSTHLWAMLVYSSFDEAFEAVTEMNGQVGSQAAIPLATTTHTERGICWMVWFSPLSSPCDEHCRS